MGKLKPVSAKKLIQKLKKVGFIETHWRGSHLYLISADSQRIVTVPVHGNKEIPVGTLHNVVIHQAGLKADDFNKL